MNQPMVHDTNNKTSSYYESKPKGYNSRNIVKTILQKRRKCRRTIINNNRKKQYGKFKKRENMLAKRVGIQIKTNTFQVAHQNDKEVAKLQAMIIFNVKELLLEQ